MSKKKKSKTNPNNNNDQTEKVVIQTLIELAEHIFESEPLSEEDTDLAASFVEEELDDEDDLADFFHDDITGGDYGY